MSVSVHHDSAGSVDVASDLAFFPRPLLKSSNMDAKSVSSIPASSSAALFFCSTTAAGWAVVRWQRRCEARVPTKAIVRRYGKPDYFITFTANPGWPEIADNLAPGDHAVNRPDLGLQRGIDCHPVL